jgi:hypothetical protein
MKCQDRLISIIFSQKEQQMAKKGLFVLVSACFIAGGVFAQDSDAVHKHEPFDMLLGVNLGLGITPNIGDLFSISSGVLPKGNYALTFDFGLTYDFYLFNWLSFNTGLLLHPDIYAILNQDLNGVDSYADVAATPLCLTIPFAVHVNVPKAEWLYVGVGLTLNLPVSGMLDEVTGIDTKGDFFVGLPVDLGFDYIKAGKGGGRFFFRITPEFHKKGTVLPIGFMFQMYNWKIYSKN